MIREVRTQGLGSDAARVTVLNRGIAGTGFGSTRHRRTHPGRRSGLSRFDEDVIGITAVTYEVLAHVSNDIGLPGEAAFPCDLPSAAQIVDAYQRLLGRARAAGLGVIMTPIIPMPPLQGDDPSREQIRLAVNVWMRTSSPDGVDFDEFLRSESAPGRLATVYDVGDHQHPIVAGEQRLARNGRSHHPAKSLEANRRS